MKEVDTVEKIQDCIMYKTTQLHVHAFTSKCTHERRETILGKEYMGKGEGERGRQRGEEEREMFESEQERERGRLK